VREKCRGTGVVYSEELHFARSYHKTLRRNFLPFIDAKLWETQNYPLSYAGNANET
jgi:hypothetical protein